MGRRWNGQTETVMRLTLHSDYALRALLFLAVREESSISEVAATYGISRNHLVKVVHHLARAGYIDSQQGRGGGIRLARAPEEITVGQVVRECEPHFHLVECFDEGKSCCAVSPECKLKHALAEAFDAFMAVLDRHTLADISANREQLANLLGIEQPGDGAWPQSRDE